MGSLIREIVWAYEKMQERGHENLQLEVGPKVFAQICIEADMPVHPQKFEVCGMPGRVSEDKEGFMITGTRA